MFPLFLRTLSIFLMIAAGYLVRRRRLVDEPFGRQLSQLLVNLFYPALILSSMTRNYTFDSLLANWPLPAGAFLIMCAGWLLGRLALTGLRGQPEPLRHMFHFDCAINNYSFLPIMLAASLLGPHAVAQVVFAALGAEVAVWTLGVQSLTGHAVSRRMLRSLLTMPMIVMLLAIALLGARFLLARAGLHAAALPAPILQTGEMALNTCHLIGQATIPVSAVICGIGIASLEADHLFSRPILGLTILRLLIIPALAISALHLLHLPHSMKQVLTIIAVQPCSMASVSLAELYRTDTRFAAAAVLATHAACLFSIPVWVVLFV